MLANSVIAIGAVVVDDPLPAQPASPSAHTSASAQIRDLSARIGPSREGSRCRERQEFTASQPSPSARSGLVVASRPGSRPYPTNVPLSGLMGPYRCISTDVVCRKGAEG